MEKMKRYRKKHHRRKRVHYKGLTHIGKNRYENEDGDIVVKRGRKFYQITDVQMGIHEQHRITKDKYVLLFERFTKLINIIFWLIIIGGLYYIITISR